MMASFDAGIAVGLGGIGLMLPFAVIALSAWGIQKAREAIRTGYFARIGKLQTALRKSEDDRERAISELAAIDRVLDDYDVAKTEKWTDRGVLKDTAMSTARRVRVAMEAKKS